MRKYTTLQILTPFLLYFTLQNSSSDVVYIFFSIFSTIRLSVLSPESCWIKLSNTQQWRMRENWAGYSINNNWKQAWKLLFSSRGLLYTPDHFRWNILTFLQKCMFDKGDIRPVEESWAAEFNAFNKRNYMPINNYKLSKH